MLPVTAIGTGLAKQLKRNVTRIRWPLLAVERAQTRQHTGERGVMTSRHGESDTHLASSSFPQPSILTADFIDTQPRALDLGRHTFDNVAHQPANAQHPVLSVLIVSVKPLLDADAVDDLSGLAVVELPRQPGLGSMRERRVDRVHDARQPRVRVDRDGLVAALRHPLPDQLGQVFHVVRLVPPVRRALGKGPRELCEATTVAVVREQRLVGRRAGDDRGRRERRRACRQRVHAPESLLHGLEGSRQRRGPKVDQVGVGDEFRHELELLDVQVAQAPAEFVRCVAPFVCEFAELAVYKTHNQSSVTILGYT